MLPVSEKVCMHRKNNIYMVWYYPWFQAQIRGDDCMSTYSLSICGFKSHVLSLSWLFCSEIRPEALERWVEIMETGCLCNAYTVGHETARTQGGHCQFCAAPSSFTEVPQPFINSEIRSHSISSGPVSSAQDGAFNVAM